MINLKYFDTIRMMLRSGKVGDEYVQKTQTIKVVLNKASLEELPDFQYHVRIDGYTELSETAYNITKTIPPLQFYVNYENGMIYFNATEEGKSLVVDYKGRGYIQYPAERIYVHNDGVPIDEQYPYTIDNLQDFLDFVAWKTQEFTQFVADKITEVTDFVNTKKQEMLDFILLKQQEITTYVDEKVEFVTNLAKDFDWFVFEKTEEVIEFVDDTKDRVNQYVEDKVDEYQEHIEDKYAEYVDYVDDYVAIADDKIDEMDLHIIASDAQTDYCKQATDTCVIETNKSIEATSDCIVATDDTIEIYNQCLDLHDELSEEILIAQSELSELDKAIISTRLIMQPPVQSFAEITLTYPSPEIGWGVQTEEDGDIYRWNGLIWQRAYNLQGSIVIATEEMNGIMSKEMVQKFNRVEDNAQVNFTGENAKTALPDYFRTRTVVFVLSGGLSQGSQGVNIQVPFDGNIVDVRGYCNTMGSTNTELDIEKASEAEFDTDTWTSVFQADKHLIIPSNERSIITYIMQDSVVTKNDFFRINVSNVGTGIQDITIQIDIKI